MEQPEVCIFCGSDDINDDGIEVDVDPIGYWHTAHNDFRCNACKGMWQYNATVYIEFDYSKPQVTIRGG
jgi:hypothetical protein